MELQNTEKSSLQPIDLKFIPDNLIVNMLKKFSFIEGTRARKTCRFMNDLVNKGDIAFANYENTSYSLVIQIKHNYCTICISGYSLPRNRNVRGIAKFYNVVLNESHKCVVFEEIQLFRLTPPLQEEWDQLFRLEEISDSAFSDFEKFNIKCTRLSLINVPATNFPRLLSTIFCERFVLEDTPHPLYEAIESVPSYRCRDLLIFAIEMPSIGIKIERIAHLEQLRLIGHRPQWELPFARFLQEVLNHPPGRLKVVDVDISPRFRSDEYSTESWPNSSFIWQGIVRMYYFDSEPLYYQFHLMETRWSTLVIITFDRVIWKNKHSKVVFLKKNNCEEIVLAVFEELYHQHKPIDMSLIYEELNGSTPDCHPFLLRKYLQILCPHEESHVPEW